MKITAKRIPKSLHSTLFVLIAIFFWGCGKSQNSAIDTRQNETKTIQMQVQADIGLLALGGQSVEYVATPPKYKPGDNLITYEGPGWESQMVGYRLYLDGRNAIDVFGKKTADMILKQVGRGDDYHQMQPWGMDILKVGSSLGSGGFGVHENGEAVQIGPAAQFSAQILKNGPQMSIVEVNHRQSQKCGGDITARYTIKSRSRLTRVEVDSQCRLPLVAGLVKHPDTKKIFQLKKQADWSYIARYGGQSLVPDNLGLAIFFRSEDIVSLGEDPDDDYIIFKNDRNPEYFLAATWEQEPAGIRNNSDFLIWLTDTLVELNTTSP